MTHITEQLDHLQRRIDFAAQSAGRNADSVRIVAVSKKQPVEAIRAAREAGLRDFGENYVQEAIDKIPRIDADARWHFIGPVQSNKTRSIAENFDWVHAVTSRRIAERLSVQRPDERSDLNVCIQLQPENAVDRNGISATELPGLIETIAGLPNLRLRGLMMMPPPGIGPAATRTEFARANRLFDKLRADGYELDTLSMGMSADLEAAIMEGSTCIRIGTDLFGARRDG